MQTNILQIEGRTNTGLPKNTVIVPKNKLIEMLSEENLNLDNLVIARYPLTKMSNCIELNSVNVE